MRNALAAVSALSFLTLTALPASAHEASQVRYELGQRGYYDIQFIVAEPPQFQVNACRHGERFHLHVDFYGHVTERSRVGRCRGHWGFNRRDAEDRYRRY